MNREHEKRDSVQWTQQITPRLFKLLGPSEQKQRKADEVKGERETSRDQRAITDYPC
jgi:hypothetical protein